ncbi:MAG: neutral zinc metallopeptidase [Bacteroidales bacterium]|nr:neutral zinc metallopeptidase [Bacteroidales bacterium]MDY6348811.1 neutral zinc metallopeptidase [Bacteroidales bacterium]
MQLEGRRKSSNVEDRRRISGGTVAGVGVGGTIIVVLLSMFLGRNPQEVLQQIQSQNVTTVDNQREFTKEEQELADFASTILASTEDVWTEVFKKMGRTYRAPKMVLYTDAVQSGCGNATSAVGPFYCSADECLYIDLSFFSTMKQQLGADGDFAYAYVIAHEVGHHVQHLLGTLDQAHAQMSRMNEKDANKVSVRIELQADFYAGVWGYYENKTFQSLDDVDLKEAIECAAVIGDDYLQTKARGGFNPESFTHGSSNQRMKWLKLGLTTGDMSRGDTFSVPESQL